MSGRPELSRRDFLRGKVLPGLGTAAATAARLQEFPGDAPASEAPPTPVARRFERSFPIVRPPGAVAEEEFLDRCTKCEACIKACPHQAIVHAPDRFRRAAGTPMIDPIQQPCWMCTDFPCIAACEPRVLEMSRAKRMATATIESFACLAWQGSFCSVCSEQCPVPDAIRIENGRPRIAGDVCTGCGVCQYVCPAPENAILLMPLADRPASTTAGRPQA